MIPAFNYPPLPAEAWDNTRITLHLYLQIVGKIMLALKPRRNHWWHMTFKFSVRGFTTGRMPFERGYVSIEFDFVNHQLVIQTSTNEHIAFNLEDGLSVADFNNRVFQALKSLDLHPEIIGVPFDHHCTEPFNECLTYHHYDKEYVSRFWQIMSHMACIFEVFNTEFQGKVSPVQVYWHHMDLAVGRFNGNRAPAMPEDARESDKDAYSHEVISAGFWAGDENVRGPAFYSYTYPSPEGLENEPVLPEAAFWDMSSGTPMAMLMYEDISREKDPDKLILDFLRSTYEAGAKKAEWELESLKYTPPL